MSYSMFVFCDLRALFIFFYGGMEVFDEMIILELSYKLTFVEDVTSSPSHLLRLLLPT